MTIMVFLVLCGFILAQAFSDVDSAGLLQQPEPQHVLDGSNATFSCRICDSYVIWKVMFSDGTTIGNLQIMQRPDVHITTRPPEGSERTSILTINIPDASIWNNTMLQCVVHYGNDNIQRSRYVALVIYTSLRPSSLSNMWISVINATTITLNWIPVFLWQGYQIDNFRLSVNITNKSNSERVLETSVDFEETIEPIKHFTFSNNITAFLYPCTEFLFSVSSVSAMYGESDPMVLSGGFDEVPNEAIIVNKVVYFTSNGTPLVEVEVELPGNVCSYQDINYTIVIEEQPPSGFNPGFIVGPFSHHGSGRVNQRIISGLVMRKNYSLSVIVNTSVGNSKTKTYFDTGTWLEVSDDNIITSSDQLENVVTVSHKNMTHYIIITLGTLLSVALLIIIGFIALFVSFCFAKKKKKYGGHNTNRKIMVHNPIYDRGPVYDTIPITLSETLADSEVNNEASTISGFQKSSTFTNAYVDEPHSSPLQRISLDNVHAPSVSFNLKDDVAKVSTATPGSSLEKEPIGQVVTDHGKGEESSYTLMLPAAGGMFANSKS